ncbi:AsmA-like C-terminal region [Maridesulfovibrio ferrireducens]|uniref:AsmA-like C-terminal region n=1 Tax=Maridesulfovibrio ferrireducens TaxID=246191 RepID=A0A1G9H176_9BACT|nr:hypothetical protein [Maridesulfovibrio ferrireducens]SDL06622.1 AsmA-like C-terminal region [Maridesulfovibrio ferrireducens]
MLRKKGLLIAGLVAAIILAGSIVLVRVYFVDAAQNLLSEMTEMGVVMEDIEIHYSPLPYLLVHNLEINNGTDSVRIPMLEIYPDIPSLLVGNIKLRHVILQDPDIQTAAHRSGSDSTGFEMPEFFPARLDVVSGKLLLTNGYQGTPLTVSASMEKETGGFSFNVRSASIAELGFKFSGKMDMLSASPLKLGLQATECSIDPAAFLGFLTGFGYLGNSTIPELADAGKFETRNLDFNVDSAMGTMSFQAGELVLDQSNGKNLSVNIGQGGSYQISIEEIHIDAGELYSMAQKSERGRNATQALCDSAKLKSIKPKGQLILKSVSLSSPASSVNTSRSAGLSGKMTVSAKDLALILESSEGKKQELNISDIDADIEIKDGKPIVSVRTFNVASVAGGDCNLQASFSFPFEMRQVRFKAEARDFSLFDYMITGDAEKKSPLKTLFDTQLVNKGTKISASGYFNSPYDKRAGLEAVLYSLSIRSPEQNDTDPVDKNFDFSVLLGGTLNGKASIRRFYYNDWPFSDVAVYLQSGATRAVLKASGKLFHLNLNADAVFSKEELAAQCSVKGRGDSLPSLIACFAEDLSVSLRGKVYLNANVFVQGKRPKELAESAQGDGTILVDGLQILNLANIDPRLGFFIDILDAVSKKSEAGEGLNFNSARVRAAISGKKVVIDSFSLEGNLLQAWGDGTYFLNDNRLKLDGKVRSLLGTVNTVNIDRRLKS